MHSSVLGMLGVQNVGGRFMSGLGDVQPHQPQGALGDDGAVMMISGVPEQALADRVGRTLNPSAPAQPDFLGQLQMPVTLFNVTLPLWAWLLIAAALGGGVSWAALKRKG